MKTFLISDTHFNHKRILEFDENRNARPFRSVEEMDKTLINKWNSVVSKQDTVFHLGDFSFCNFEKSKAIFNRLNGRIHLVMGNHCRSRSVSWFKNVGFYQVYKYPICFKNYFWLSHEPMVLDKKSNYINIHGHIHSPGRMKQFENVLSDSNHINVCAEMINFTPISLGDLIKNAPHNHRVKEIERFLDDDKKGDKHE